MRNGSCTVLRDDVALRPGQDVRLRLTVGVDTALDRRHGQRGTVGFRLRGVLIEAAAAEPDAPGSRCQQPSEPPSTPSDPDLDELPATGSGAWLPLGLLGGASTAAGIIFCGLAWRRRQPDEAGAPDRNLSSSCGRRSSQTWFRARCSPIS